MSSQPTGHWTDIYKGFLRLALAVFKSSLIAATPAATFVFVVICIADDINLKNMK